MTDREFKHWLTPAEHSTYRFLFWAIAFNWAINCRAALEQLAEARRDAYIMAQCLESSCYVGEDSLAPWRQAAVFRSLYGGLRVKQARYWTPARSAQMTQTRNRLERK